MVEKVVRGGREYSRLDDDLFGFTLFRLTNDNRLIVYYESCGENLFFDFDALVGRCWQIDDCTDGPAVCISVLERDVPYSAEGLVDRGCMAFALDLCFTTTFVATYEVCPDLGITFFDSFNSGRLFLVAISAVAE